LAKISRGGARFAISYTGGNMSPHTYVIDAFKNWNNEATIAVEKFGHANYITSFRISRREGTGNNDYYLEGEFTSLSYTHSFEARFQESLGYTNISEIYAVSSGYLVASNSDDAEIIEELDTTDAEGLYLKNINLGGRLNLYTDSNTTSSTALVLNGTEVENNADVTDTANVVAALTAGTNVTIASNGTISSVDTTYTTSDFDAAGSADAVQSNLDTVAANIAGISKQSNTDVDTGTETIAQVSKGTYTAAFFDFVIKNGTNVRCGTVYSCHDGTNVEFTETSTVDLGDTSDVTLAVDISGTNMRLRATTTSDNWSVKSLVRAI
jgi:hypothetical protein